MREELFYKKCRIFFVDKRDDHLEKLGCRLNILQMLILWEIFRKKLECLYRNSPKGGRRVFFKGWGEKTDGDSEGIKMRPRGRNNSPAESENGG